MVSLEKWIILTPLQNLHKNGEDWGKLIVAKGFKRLPKVQNITQSGHTASNHFLDNLAESGRWKYKDRLELNFLAIPGFGEFYKSGFVRISAMPMLRLRR